MEKVHSRAFAGHLKVFDKVEWCIHVFFYTLLMRAICFSLCLKFSLFEAIIMHYKCTGERPGSTVTKGQQDTACCHPSSLLPTRYLHTENTAFFRRVLLLHRILLLLTQRTQHYYMYVHIAVSSCHTQTMSRTTGSMRTLCSLVESSPGRETALLPPGETCTRGGGKGGRGGLRLTFLLPGFRLCCWRLGR